MDFGRIKPRRERRPTHGRTWCSDETKVPFSARPRDRYRAAAVVQSTNKRLRIAIVDQDESVRNAMRRLLRAAGMEAEMFAGAEAFTATLPRHNLDCVLVDACLPEMQSGVLLRRLSRHDCAIPAIAFVAHDERKPPPRDDPGDPSSPVVVVLKPLNDAALLRHIREAVKNEHA